MNEYERGQWHALDRVLALLQTYDKRMVRKADLYADIMELRPVPDQRAKAPDEHRAEID